MQALLAIGTVTVALGLGALVLGLERSLVRVRPEGDAIDAILADEALGAEAQRPFIERLIGPAFGSFGRVASALTPSFWRERIAHNASVAGMGSWGVDGILALKTLFAVVAAGGILMLSGVFGLTAPVMWAVLGALVAFFIPDLGIARRVDARQDEIRNTLPEALDLLAIAVQAGMGLEAAIELVARRLPGALGEELARMLQEVQLGASRREALQSLRDRTEVSELSTFALALAQADALGTPLGEVLRVQAVQMRMMRRQRAREKAAKVPVKLLFPLLSCIFPALFITVVGPAAITIAHAFAH